MGHYPEVRKNLGVPGKGLQPGDRLLSAVKHIPGIQSEYLYVSEGLSVAGAHEEDARLPSGNLNYWGAPKLWIVINPSSRDEFLVQMVKTCHVKVRCDQFLRHTSSLPRPSQLHDWGVLFQVILQPPGCLILLKPNAIHWVLNLGANLAGAINYAKSDWDVPINYVECQKDCTGSDPIRVTDFKVSKLRDLDIDTEWEAFPEGDSHDNSTDNVKNASLATMLGKKPSDIQVPRRSTRKHRAPCSRTQQDVSVPTPNKSRQTNNLKASYRQNWRGSLDLLKIRESLRSASLQLVLMNQLLYLLPPNHFLGLPRRLPLACL